MSVFSSRANRRGKVNVPILVGGVAITLGIVALLGSGFGRDPFELNTEQLNGKRAPVYDLLNLEGDPVLLSDAIGEQWVVLNFWSTWCGPCKVEHPHLVEAAQYYPNVKFVGVVYQDDPKKATDFLAVHRAKSGRSDEKWNNPGTHVIDPEGRMSVDYGVTGVPETFFINPEGIVVKKYAHPIGAREIMAHLGPPNMRLQ